MGGSKDSEVSAEFVFESSNKLVPTMDMNGAADERMEHREANFFVDVPRQIFALSKKNLILAYRNRTATFLRIFSSFFFILLIFLVNEALKGRYAADPYYKDYPNPSRKVWEGIPACVQQAGSSQCFTFIYAPAPDKSGRGYHPEDSVISLAEFAQKGFCEGVPPPNSTCGEMYRVHQVVKNIMNLNMVDGKRKPITSKDVLGFRNQTALDDFLFQNPNIARGGYVFASPGDKAMTFVVQVNSTSYTIRGEWFRPYLDSAVPLQALAHKAIAKFFNPDQTIELATQLFAHPAFAVSSFEGVVAPLFLLGCAMFPFVIQMNEVVMERELKLRQALQAMGLYDTAYWLSWHIYQSGMAWLFGFFIWVFGMIFQFRMFHKNDFGIVFLTFWLFGQSMVGLGFLIGAILSRGAQAVTAGFAVFLVGFVLYFMIAFAGLPYGSDTAAPFSYTMNITTGNYTKKDNGDVVLAPLLAAIPPTLLIQCIADMGRFTAADTAKGIRFSEADSYCTLDKMCDPEYSISDCWGCFIALYFIYSLLGLFLENILPDAMGVRKPPWYFLNPSYWGITTAKIEDKIVVIEASTDEDVITEEKSSQTRANQAISHTSAIEIRGLRATFKRGGKEFHAVKCPWYCVGKRQLFALLGPNGAGKTTTINMLTGFLPPTDGNALVFGETVSHSSGMAKIRRFMGVCPQFDILWDNLSAKEHLVLFGTIKGLMSNSVVAEAEKRIEEVRLTESANQRAGAFSGGMKRRLSVAVALIGNPEVVYLDEPTTGMDPINRRHVWDVVEAAKQDRSVVLTTHSMEEADILGDRIGIMCKGRLRCIGNSVRLKSRFGEGYKVSVSCGDNMKPDSDKCVRVKEFFSENLGISVTEETKAYMHFNAPVEQDAKMARFFKQLEELRGELGIVDVQLSMSTLEDVFLKIATASELEEAKKNAKTTIVTLENGEQVGVLMGSEEALTSPQGVTFTVRWGTDEDGRLIPVEISHVQMQEQQIMVTCPEGTGEGQLVRVMAEKQAFNVAVPPGVTPGQQFRVTVKVPKMDRSVSREDNNTSQFILSDQEVQDRVKKLRTPFFGQANALFRKNLSFQWKRRVTNCCLVLVPLFVLALVFGIQLLIEILLLSKPVIRCPYCGPADDFGKYYCNKVDSCAQYFFPNSSRQDYINKYGVDVSAQCSAIAGEGPLGKKDPRYCFGNGNVSCFQVQWAGFSQVGFCPFRGSGLPTNPSFGNTPIPAGQSQTPMLLTSDAPSKDFATKVGIKTASAPSDIRSKIKGAVAETNRMLFLQFAGIPWLGCQGLSSLELEQSVCKVLSPGTAMDDVCCLDFTGNSSSESFMGLAQWNVEKFVGDLRFGVNYWSDMDAHTDEAYNNYMSTCTNDKGVCNRLVMEQWVKMPRPAGKYGVRFGTGQGQYLASFEMQHLLQAQGLPVQLQNLVVNDFNAMLQNMSAAQSFKCVLPTLPTEYPARMAARTCPSLEEGLAVLAQASKLPKELHPIFELETQEVPKCTEQKACSFNSTTVNGVKLLADSHGRWAQLCDFYTLGMEDQLDNSNGACTAEKVKKPSLTCPDANEALKGYLRTVPCMCRWIYFAKVFALSTYFTIGPSATILRQLPRQYQCRPLPEGGQDCTPSNPMDDPANSRKPTVMRPSGCWRKHYNPFSMPELRFVTPNFPGRDFLQESALTRDTKGWWNRPHVLMPSQKADSDKELADAMGSCESSKDCWLQAGLGNGNFSFLAVDCSQVAEEACFLKRMGNLSGLSVGCVSTNPTFYDDRGKLNTALYDGQYSQYGSKLLAKEYLGGYDLLNSNSSLLNVSVFYNDTTQVILDFGNGNPTPPWVRISQPLNAVVDAFLNVGTDATSRIYASFMGVRDMPKIATFLSLDIGSALGPFFFTLAFNILFPTIVVSLVYEKEVKLRVMMRMMGLGTSAYWVINYVFWFLIYALFTFIFILVGSIVKLSSGYTLGLFTRQNYSVHFIFFLFFINHTIAHAMLWSSLIRASRSASISSTLYVIGMSVIAFTAWDAGNFFNTDTVSTDLKTFITLWPIWGFYRGWSEYKNYAVQGAFLGTSGIQWSDIGTDPKCGMGAVLAVLGVEWPFFLIFSLYLDQVLDSGHRVPRHPLFFLGYKYEQALRSNDVEASGGLESGEDVKQEEHRVRDMLESSEGRDAVIIKEINKVYPAYMGNPAKMAVRTLTMSVAHGECFGMLGPNGAGKTTTINMLVGFTQPTAGTAEIEGFDICSDMDRIYTLMGVCPQHDILWETLTARQHMLFYGRLKNLSGAALNEAVVAGLKSVNLLHVMNEMSGTFSGGMKRRLSIAISMIGNPLCCYLDEPSTGLDPASRRTLWVCIKEAKRSRAILLTTHSMEEAEGLCDRLGIFVDGALRCIGNPKELTARFGGYYILTITCESGKEGAVSDLVHTMADGVRITYSISGTQKFEIPSDKVTLAKVFEVMTENKDRLSIRDWGIANTTLEEAFIKISRGAVGT